MVHGNGEEATGQNGHGTKGPPCSAAEGQTPQPGQTFGDLGKSGELFLRVALDKGLLNEGQAKDIRRTVGTLKGMGLGLGVAQVVREKGYLSESGLQEIRREMAKRGERPRLGGYEILSRLGAGGMGTVYKARQVSLDRVVAIKTLSREQANDKTFVERFRREALLAARLTHPNAVQIHDVGEDRGHHFLVMEHVDGASADRLIEQGPLDENRAAAIVRDISGALAEAHALGIVHRDIKPANILVSHNGTAKLADLGIAKSADPLSGTLTQTGAQIGTPLYMSPEQCRGERDLDARSDIYSLGATLHHLVCGCPPYESDSALALIQRHIQAPLPDPKAANPALSEGMCDLIRRMMAKDPGDRPSSCAEVVKSLDRLVNEAGQPEQAPPLPAQAQPEQGQAPPPQDAAKAPEPACSGEQAQQEKGAEESLPSGEETASGAHRGFPVWVAAACALALVLVALAGLLINRLSQRPSVAREAEKSAALDGLEDMEARLPAEAWPTAPSERDPAAAPDAAERPEAPSEVLAVDVAPETPPEPVAERPPEPAAPLAEEPPAPDAPPPALEPMAGAEPEPAAEDAPVPAAVSRQVGKALEKRVERTFFMAKPLKKAVGQIAAGAGLQVEFADGVSEAVERNVSTIVSGSVAECLEALLHPRSLAYDTTDEGIFIRERTLEDIQESARQRTAVIMPPEEPEEEALATDQPGREWRAQRRRVVVATPGGHERRAITYYANTIGMQFVRIPAGVFFMGETGSQDAEPVHRVRIHESFYMGAYEVTQGQWEAVMGANPARFMNAGEDGPVERVSWEDCQEFLKKLCELEGVPEGTYRLPTEAEWEYAARAGSRTKYYFGDDESMLDAYAWYRNNSGNLTHPVGEKIPNAWGLYDMYGNVWEWCQSLYKYYPYRADDGRESLTASGHRVVRGGSWQVSALHCTSARRAHPGLLGYHDLTGLRVVAVPSPQE